MTASSLVPRPSPLDGIILGHNQFFGVAHLSSAKGAERDQQFSDIGNVMKMIEAVMDEGVDAMMLSTHPRADEICRRIAADPRVREKLTLYPVLPYIAKYVRLANEKGLANMVLDIVSGAGTMGTIGMMLKGGAGALTGDVYKMIELLIDVEMTIFKGTRMRAIFLHQALTDLALGLDLRDVFLFYHDYIPKKFPGVEAAWCTFNLPMLLEKFESWGIGNPIVMPPLNKIGFQMQPSLDANAAALRAHSCRVVAMSTLAGGFLPPTEAYAWLYQQPNIASVVVGASNRRHATETFAAIRRAREARQG